MSGQISGSAGDDCDHIADTQPPSSVSTPSPLYYTVLCASAGRSDIGGRVIARHPLLPPSALPIRWPPSPPPSPLPLSSLLSLPMHGRVKKGVQPTAEEAATKRAQVAKYITAKDLFLHRRQQHLVDDKTKDLTAKLIELNPDFYSLWNLRKEIALAAFKAQSVSAIHLPPHPPVPPLPLPVLPLTAAVVGCVPPPPVWQS